MSHTGSIVSANSKRTNSDNREAYCVREHEDTRRVLLEQRTNRFKQGTHYKVAAFRRLTSIVRHQMRKNREAQSRSGRSFVANRERPKTTRARANRVSPH